MLVRRICKSYPFDSRYRYLYSPRSRAFDRGFSRASAPAQPPLRVQRRTVAHVARGFRVKRAREESTNGTTAARRRSSSLPHLLVVVVRSSRRAPTTAAAGETAAADAIARAAADASPCRQCALEMTSRSPRMTRLSLPRRRSRRARRRGRFGVYGFR